MQKNDNASKAASLATASSYRVKEYVRLRTILAILITVPCVAFLLAGFGAAGYAAYRHGKALSRLPKPSLQPERLAAPLSDAEFHRGGPRWVEIDATPLPNTTGRQTSYRNSAESANALILRFTSEPGDSKRTTYRGILYTFQTARSRGGIPERLKADLRESAITPARQFAVLLVGESPWQIVVSTLKEWLAVAATALTATFLLFLAVRTIGWALRPARDSALASVTRSVKRMGSWPAVIAAASAILGISWMLIRSGPGQPVLPIETLAALGVSSALGLLPTIRRILMSTVGCRLRRGNA